MLKVGIIGTGAIAPSHIEGYLEFPERCKIVALCDIYPEKAEKSAEKYNLEVDIYDSHQKMLDRNDLDLISVCTPPYTHAEITTDFLNADTNVICEKPMASSLNECDSMNAAAEKNKKLLSVISQNRFTNPMMKLKKVLESELVGEIVHTQVDSFWWRGYAYYDLWWRGTWEKEGGGPTLNHAVHHIDIFRWMNGMPAEINAVMSNTSHDNAEVEDISIAIGKYSDGSLAQITSSVVHHGQEQQLIFQGKKARVSVPWDVYAFTAKENGFPEKNNELEIELENFYNGLEDLDYEGHTGQIDNVLTALEDESEVLIDGNDGRKTLELITAIYQSATFNKKIDLPLTEKSPFYSREGLINNAHKFYKKKKSIENFTDTEITTGRNLE